MVSLIRATALRGYPALVRELGGDPKAYFARFEIPFGIEDDDDAFISVLSFGHMIETTAVELQCTDFGLRLSALRGIGIAGPIAVIIRNSEFVLEALQAGIRYSYAHSPAYAMALERPSDTTARLTYEVIEPRLGVYPLQAYEMSVGTLVRSHRLLAGNDAPVTVSFMHSQLATDAAYHDALGCSVRFEETWCGLEVPSYVLEQRIDNTDPTARSIAIKYLEATYLPSVVPLADHVAELARRLLPTGHCGLDTIAEQLVMHPRTLQRRLATEGLTCQEVIDGERRRQATKYLAQPGLHLSQIASMLGYSEQSAFNRSCRRWFGMTPRQIREGAHS
jgi:AraC-like DNA-binding protein